MTTKTAAPETKPIKANQDMFLKYQKKLIFSIPIATTPAADPIINILPPVPAEYAIKCHNGSFIGSVNMPKLAATSGTLSIIAEPIPISITKTSSGIICFKSVANSKSIPKDSKAPTAINIPKKNRILGSSILVNALCTGLT